MRRHVLSDRDDELMRRWKGNGLATYTQHVQDDDHVVAFNAGDFRLEVEAGMYGVPIFTDEDRELLALAMSEIESSRRW